MFLRTEGFLYFYFVVSGWTFLAACGSIGMADSSFRFHQPGYRGRVPKTPENF